MGVLFCMKHLTALFCPALCLCVSLKCYYVYTCNHIFCTSCLFHYHQHVCLSPLAHLGDPTQAVKCQKNYHWNVSQHYNQTFLLKPQGLHFLHPILFIWRYSKCHKLYTNDISGILLLCSVSDKIHLDTQFQWNSPKMQNIFTVPLHTNGWR